MVLRFLSKILKKSAEKKPSGQIVGNLQGENDTQNESRETAKVPGLVTMEAIRAPRLTEKAAAMAKQGQYVFTVASRANKVRVRQAVEARYGVKVRMVRMAKTSGKKRSRGRQIGWRPGIKKAVVTLEKGQTIELQ